MLRYKTKTRPGLVALYDVQETERVYSYNPGVRTGPDVCLTSVAYIGPKSRAERPRKDQNWHRPKDPSQTWLRLSRSKGSSHQAALDGCSSHYIMYISLSTPPPRASSCLSIMNIHGARRAGPLGAAGVRRVGYGLEVGRSVRTAGGAGACVATRTILFSLSYSTS